MNHIVLVDAVGCAPQWGLTGSWWMTYGPSLGPIHAPNEEPFEWLRAHAHGDWQWDAVGDVGQPQEHVLDNTHFVDFTTFHFRFYFALAQDAMLFKLTWT